MSFIVVGLRKPKSCEEWRNGGLKRCPLLGENDVCKAQKKANTRMTWEEQLENCPIVNLKRKHGRLIDASTGEVVFRAENDTWGG